MAQLDPNNRGKFKPHLWPDIMCQYILRFSCFRNKCGTTASLT